MNMYSKKKYYEILLVFLALLSLFVVIKVVANLSSINILKDIYGANYIYTEGNHYYTNQFLDKSLFVDLAGIEDSLINNALPYTFTIGGFSFWSSDDGLNGTKVVDVLFTNHSSYDLNVSPDYRIEQKINGVWFSCRHVQSAVHGFEYIPAGESVMHKFVLSYLLDPYNDRSKPVFKEFINGEYRILRKVESGFYISIEFTYTQ